MSIRDKALLYTGCATGLRISELLSLTRAELIDSAGSICRRVWLDKKRMKGRKRGRVVWLDRAAVRSLRQWLRQQPATETRAFPITRQQAGNIIRSAAARAGINAEGIGTHSMRKTFAARADKAFNGNLTIIQEMIGHEDPRTTLRYLRWGSERELWRRMHAPTSRKQENNR